MIYEQVKLLEDDNQRLHNRWAQRSSRIASLSTQIQQLQTQLQIVTAQRDNYKEQLINTKLILNTITTTTDQATAIKLYNQMKDM